MALLEISPRIRGFISTTAHPDGCAAHVLQQIAIAKSAHAKGIGANTRPLRTLVIGGSTGYGLAARIAATYLLDSPTLGVFYERPADGSRTASPGWYNTATFAQAAEQAGRVALQINGDAFSSAVKELAISTIREAMAQVDVVIYSLASPRRTDPVTGEVYSSVLKPIGSVYTSKTVDLNSEEVIETSVAPATPEEVAGSIHVMGGDDLRLWVEALLAAAVLARGAMVLPLSYIGPELTHPIYRSGTIGKAKEHIEATTRELDGVLQAQIGGRALVSVNKIVVTQASAAIPTVPLYYSAVTRILKERGEHEEPIDQMIRLFGECLAGGVDALPALDSEDRIRLDDREMNPDVQSKTMALWSGITTENLNDVSDWQGYKRGFRNLFGFEMDGVDYSVPVEADRPIPLVCAD